MWKLDRGHNFCLNRLVCHLLLNIFVRTSQQLVSGNRLFHAWSHGNITKVVLSQINLNRMIWVSGKRIFKKVLLALFAKMLGAFDWSMFNPHCGSLVPVCHILLWFSYRIPLNFSSSNFNIFVVNIIIFWILEVTPIIWRQSPSLPNLLWFTHIRMGA